MGIENREKEILGWFDSLGKFGSKPGLDVISFLLDIMGNPQNRFSCVHVTGTNGKGSTAMMVASIVEEAGYKVGLFTSPYLSVFTESIRVNRKEMEINCAVRLLEDIRKSIEKMMEKEYRHPTSFEVLTALALRYFSEVGVDYAVIEVGMGGRDDATNVINSIVSVITNVSLEHTHWLGNTVEEISEVKAGIIKSNSVLITAVRQPSVIRLLKRICDEKHARMYLVNKDIKLNMLKIFRDYQTFNVTGIKDSYIGVRTLLIGEHQAINAACAIGAVEALTEYGAVISKISVMNGLSKAKWPGRLELIQEEPQVILDGAKDYEAVKALVKTVKDVFKYNKLVTIVSISSDKNIPMMIEALASITDTFIVTKHRVTERSADIHVISSVIEKIGKPYEIAGNATESINFALNQVDKNDLILITGSVFFIGEAREYWTIHQKK